MRITELLKKESIELGVKVARFTENSGPVSG